MKPLRAQPNAYLKTKVLTASPAELRLMLFDGAIRFAQQARDGLAARDFETCYVGVTKCQNILMELINGLRPEHDPALCERLSALYTFMYLRLVTAGTEKRVELIDEVLKLLQYERETWQLLLDQIAAAGGAEADPKLSEAARPVGGELVAGSLSLKG